MGENRDNVGSVYSHIIMKGRQSFLGARNPASVGMPMLQCVCFYIVIPLMFLANHTSIVTASTNPHTTLHCTAINHG